MRKKGPCFHCGIEYTPLWRNGPPEKPILCNACGSRWRIWGTLDNYIPKHACASKVTSNKGTQRCQQGNSSLSIEVDNCRRPKSGADAKDSNGFEHSRNNASGSGSAMSSSDNCIHSESINEKEDSVLVQPTFWKAYIPRRRRSVIKQRILSSVESLQRQLYYILQEREFCNLSSEQEDLLILPNSQISSAEIGLGCVLLKPAASGEKDKE